MGIIIQPGQNCKCNFASDGHLRKIFFSFAPIRSGVPPQLVHNIGMNLGGLDTQRSGELVVEQTWEFDSCEQAQGTKSLVRPNLELFTPVSVRR